mmetsp:Transcript_8270/g.51539  ORF Transcript_8270/g.51539 Transcript_8270/m.51539 type:complete len:202 (+) Transcript_8270:261-866(+)
MDEAKSIENRASNGPASFCERRKREFRRRSRHRPIQLRGQARNRLEQGESVPDRSVQRGQAGSRIPGKTWLGCVAVVWIREQHQRNHHRHHFVGDHRAHHGVVAPGHWKLESVCCHLHGALLELRQPSSTPAHQHFHCHLAFLQGTGRQDQGHVQGRPTRRHRYHGVFGERLWNTQLPDWRRVAGKSHLSSASAPIRRGRG